MTQQFSNASASLLSAPIASGATSLSVASVATFVDNTGTPLVGPFQVLVAQIVGTSITNAEIMTVTAVSGTTFTVTRASEYYGGAKTAVSHATGETVALVLTAGTIAGVAPVQSVAGSGGTTGLTLSGGPTGAVTLTLGGVLNNANLATALSGHTYEGLTITPTVSGVLTIANAKTLTISNTLTISGTDGSTLAIGTGGTLGSAAFQASSAFDAAGSASAALVTAEAYTDSSLAAFTGTTNITTLGTIATGTWAGTAIAIAHGGTGQTSQASAFNALSPLTTLGDVLYGGASGAGTRLAGNTTATKNFLTQTGSGSASAAPAWGTIAAGDLPGSFSGFANPTATVGLSAVNGSATTAMRSDGAPALSQAIVPTWTGVHTHSPTQAANTSTDGIVLLDPTAATSGNQQYSGRLRMSGQGWATNTGGSSQQVDWIVENQPVQGTASPSGNLVFSSQVNGGGYTGQLTMTSGGQLFVPVGATATPSYSFAGATTTGLFCADTSTGQISFTSANHFIVNINNGTGLRLANSIAIGWCSSTPNSAPDTTLARGTSAGLVSGCSARTTGSAQFVQFQTPADTTLTAATECVGMQFGGNSSAATVTRQFNTGTIALQRENLFVAPTYGFVGNSAITEADTLYVKAPIAGTNCTGITRSNAIVSEGQLTVRQVGGTAGTNEGTISHDGTNLNFLNPAGTGSTNSITFGSSSSQCYIKAFGNISLTAVGAGQNFFNGGTYIVSTFGGFVGVNANARIIFQNGFSTVGGGFLQNTSGEAALASAFTNATAVLAATNLSVTVIAGRSYRIEGILQVSNSTAAEGVQFDFGGGACSATTFFMSCTTGDGSNVVTSTPDSTSLTGAMSFTTITGTDYIHLRGYIKANAGGTLILRAAEASPHSTGTATIGAGSWMALYDTVNL